MQVSVVVGCMNRTENLARSLPTWLQCPEIAEVIIVDWGSRMPIAKELYYIDDNRVKILQVVGVNRWLLSNAINFGILHTRFNTILKLDCDNVLRKDFFRNHPMCENMFYAGDWQSARNENEKHLNGVLMVDKASLLNIGGYNEYIRTYGWDDTDLYHRLCSVGLIKHSINADYVLHLPHTDAERGAADLHFEIVKNMHIANRHVWTSESAHTKYVQLDKFDHVEIHRPLDLEHNTLSYESLLICETLALRTVLNDCGYDWSMTRDRPHEFLLKLYYRRNRCKFYIEPKNGIGNRLRALASAAVLARATDRNLIVIWRADMHCDAEFSELFLVGDLLVCSDVDVTNIQNCSSANSQTSGGECNSHLFADGDIYVESACVFSDSRTNWALESEWLRKHIIPLPEIMHVIDQYSETFDIDNVIGVHIRMGQPAAKHAYEDSSTWDPAQRLALEKNRSDSHYMYFMEYMQEIWKTSPTQKFFICADNPEIYAAFAEYFSDTAQSLILHVEKHTYDRSLEQLQSALVDVWLLSRCTMVLGSPWSSFSELAARLGGELKVVGKDFGTTRYGLLFYPGSYNIGDDVQSLAAQAFLPRVDYLVDRDDQTANIYDVCGHLLGTFDQVLDQNKTLQIIENGWFDGRLTKFPPHRKLDPLFVSFHLNETHDLFQNHGYDAIVNLADMQRSMLDDCEKIQYLQSHVPVGTRDMHTAHMLDNAGVDAYVSGCLTLTLKPVFTSKPRNNKIYIVDSHVLESDLLKKCVPEHVLYSAKYLCHGTSALLNQRDKTQLARKYLAKYQRAKLVITSRLHCALPCIAFGTPMIFLYKNMMMDPRFDNRMRKLLGDGASIPKNWDWDNPVLSNHVIQLRDRIARKLRSRVAKFIN
jgi:glycosyltransferase involved in cell wall biosynthesis